jgi:hypothetical protein
MVFDDLAMFSAFPAVLLKKVPSRGTGSSYRLRVRVAAGSPTAAAAASTTDRLPRAGMANFCFVRMDSRLWLVSAVKAANIS